MSRFACPMPVTVGFVLLTLAPGVYAAMPEGPPPLLAQAWRWSAWTTVPVLVACAAYAAGAVRRPGSHASGRAVTAFFAGGLALGLALVWPLEAYAPYALSAHVAQHMLLLALAPPLLLAGRPLRTMRAALPTHVAGRIAGPLDRVAHRLHAPLGAATLVHVVVLWTWHLPATIAATMASDTLHRVMLASVVLAGLWFWSAVLARLRSRDGGIVGALVALVTAMMLMGFLGALLTFSPRLLYPVYTDTALLAGIDAFADQQLAGLLMWAPGGLPYVLVGLYLAVALLRGGPTRTDAGPAA
ncbi:MAG: cytochrome c oxidase assembly protein [Luteimonas sp.]